MKKLLPIDKLLWLLLAVQALINLVGALGPELGFDALWYHLPEARLFLADRSLAPIPGSLLYWSGLPRLSEAVYALVLPLSVQAPKLIHWLSGMIAAFFVFKIAKKRLPVCFSTRPCSSAGSPPPPMSILVSPPCFWPRFILPIGGGLYF